MADQTVVEDIIQSYVELLIIQYASKPKARATIDLLIRTLMQNGIYFDVDTAFDLETAVGAQLDIIGKYVGVDRTYTQQVIPSSPHFAFTTAEDIANNTENSDIGFNDATSYLTDAGIWEDISNITYTHVLTDTDYRFILKMRIIQNSSNHSHKSIDESMKMFFGDGVVMTSLNGSMTMFYFVDSANYSRAVIALRKGVLPRPMGVGLGAIQLSAPFYGFKAAGIPTIASQITGMKLAGVAQTGRTLTSASIIS